MDTNDHIELIRKDKTGMELRIGKTRVVVHTPQITPEERKLRLKEIHKQMWIVWDSLNRRGY